MYDPLPPGRARLGFDALLRDRRRGAIAVVLLVALAAVVITALRAGPAISPPGASAVDLSVAIDTTTSTAAKLVVHVAGAVVRPGVVEIPPGSRVIDAIDAAGGATRDADVAQLSLATKAVDGARVYVPKRGEQVPVPNDGATGTGTATGAEPTGPINLNTASQAQLETLPGIGPSLAKEIIATRERLGAFASVDDLRRVHGIGDRRFEQLQPLVSV